MSKVVSRISRRLAPSTNWWDDPEEVRAFYTAKFNGDLFKDASLEHEELVELIVSSVSRGPDAVEDREHAFWVLDGRPKSFDTDDLAQEHPSIDEEGNIQATYFADGTPEEDVELGASCVDLHVRDFPGPYKPGGLRKAIAEAMTREIKKTKKALQSKARGVQRKPEGLRRKKAFRTK